ncbi:MAG: cyclic nucleotide-binding domain-containing protein [Nitrospirae bacterium]|jgi:CRP-like cAMP-binding protein|nr:cyclic nucleotide-binding domain-containing protein [Nitrospirota bacterium]
MSKEVIEQLKNIKDEMIFEFLNEQDFVIIAPFFELKNYPLGTIVFKEGEPGEFIGFVLSGKLEVKKQTEFKGNQLIIAILGKGSMVGELSIFDEHKRSATVEAVEDTNLLIIKNDSINSLIEQFPYIGAKLLKGLIRILSLRLRKATERLTNIF